MSSTRIRVLVPTSERKRRGGSRAFTFSEAQEERGMNRFQSLSVPRDEALTAFLAAVNGQGYAQEVLQLAGRALEDAQELDLAIPRSPLMPALARERGPLFTALAGGKPGADLLRRIREDLVIVCPLFGLLASTDQLPEYRCPVGAQIPGWGSLHQWWKPHVTTVLNRLCRGRRVFSFLPSRLQALWRSNGKALDVVQIAFARVRGDGRVLAENAGSARLAGELARHIFTEQVTEREPVQSYRFASGHVFAPELSRFGPGSALIVFARRE